MAVPLEDICGDHVMLYYGLKQPRYGAIKFQYRDYVAPVKPPDAFGHITNDDRWGMLGNDVAGCCVVAGAAHETMLWSAAAGRPMARFDAPRVISEYADASGWNGVQNDTSDVGLDMQTYASRRRKVGVTDVNGKVYKVDAYAAIHTNEDLYQSIWLFGAIGIGVAIPDTAKEQFIKGEPWDYVPGSNVQGSHYVVGVGRNHDHHLVVVTWGRLQAVTPAFVERYVYQGIAYISQDYFQVNSETPRHFNRPLLDSHLAAL